MEILLCLLAFVSTFIAARRSVVAGLVTLTTVGYFYGILRANFPGTASHFIFDAAVLSFYIVHLFQRQSAEVRRRTGPILPWLGLLIAWPTLLVFLPIQDPIVQFVGLRGNVFLLPFLLFGARLSREEFQRLAMPLAILNVIAFAFTAAEFWVGLEPFFPHNSNTLIIYHSADVANSQFRIPSIFTGSHAYAGATVMTMPMLIGSWASPDVPLKKRMFILLSIVLSVLGIFAAASRVHIVVLGVVILATLFSGRIRAQTRAIILAVAGIIAVVVVSEARLQRIGTLQDSDYLTKRVGGSVNAGFLDLMLEHPFGNGLGGGGTSLPFSLESRVRNLTMMENEYARIMLEQTCIGLCLWLAFIVWFIFRRFSPLARIWGLTEELSWVVVVAYFGTAMIGIGLMTAIPQSMLFFLCAGSVSSWRVEQYLQVEEAPAELAAT